MDGREPLVGVPSWDSQSPKDSLEYSHLSGVGQGPLPILCPVPFPPSPVLSVSSLVCSEEWEL